MPDLAVYGLGDDSVGPDLLRARADDAPDADPRLPIAPDDVILALFTSGTTGTLKAVAAHPGDLWRGGPQRPVQPDRPEARRDHAPRRLDDPRQRQLRPALLAARRRGGDPARLRAGLLCRGDRALAAAGAQPRADHVADAVPAARHRRGRSLLGRDHRLRRLADAAAGARAGAGAVGPGLRPILRPDRSAARHLPRWPRRTMSAPRPSGCSPAAGRASNARSGWSTRTGEDVAAGRAGRDRAARALRDEGLYRSGADRAGLPARRLAAHPRHRPLRRGGLSHPGRPHLRHDRDRRLQRLSARGRGRARRAIRRSRRSPWSACPTRSGSRR